MRPVLPILAQLIPLVPQLLGRVPKPEEPIAEREGLSRGEEVVRWGVGDEDRWE